MNSNRHSMEQFKKDLLALGVCEGDTIMMHSSFKALGGIEGGAEGIFRSVKLLHETVIVDICHLSKLKERTAQSEPLCKLWAFVNNNVSTLTDQL